MHVVSSQVHRGEWACRSGEGVPKDPGDGSTEPTQDAKDSLGSPLSKGSVSTSRCSEWRLKTRWKHSGGCGFPNTCAAACGVGAGSWSGDSGGKPRPPPGTCGMKLLCPHLETVEELLPRKSVDTNLTSRGEKLKGDDDDQASTGLKL